MRSRNKRLTPFGKYVAKTLTDKDMTRAELATAIGTSPQYLSYLLNGTKPIQRYFPAIVAALALDPRKAERFIA